MTEPRRGKVRWRRLLVAIHRDVGFFCVGLTVVYAVSGVAVNHRHDWDYNYTHESSAETIGAPAELLSLPADDPARAELPRRLARERQEALITSITTALGRAEAPYNAFWRGTDRLSLFFGRADLDVVDYAPSTGVATNERKTERFLVRAFNFLHLNEGRGAWTWIADVYAILLFLLAISGIFIVKGRRGLMGRGGVYIALGVAVPIVAVLLLR